MEAGKVNDIRVNDPKPSNSGSGKVKGGGASEAACAHDEDARVFQPGLTLESDPRDDDLACEAKPLGVGESTAPGMI